MSISNSSLPFGLRLASVLLTAQPTNNIFISPLSIGMALSMAARGAVGSLNQNLYSILCVDASNEEALMRTYHSYLTQVGSMDPSVQFTIANSAWVKNVIRPDYIEQVSNIFRATIAPLTTADAINEWVNNSTQGMIDKIIENVDPLMIAILVNAVYFKGIWTKKFDPKQTSLKPFKTHNGVKQLKMMAMNDKLAYFEDDKIQAVRLSYGKEVFTATIILPKVDDNGPTVEAANSLLGSITAEKFIFIQNRMVPTKGTLFLPKMALGWGVTDITEVLKQLGCPELTMNGFLKRMTDDPEAYISAVLHKTRLELDEEGTKAAAVTAVVVKTKSRSISREPTFTMIVNKSFLIFIHNKNDILFLGKVDDPQQ